jgi:hypothetical protein
MSPSIATLEKLGLKASIRPPNDILVSGKKISGNGAITIEEANVLAGDLLMDVPSQLMSQIIKTPSEKFQDKLAESMEEWLTSIRSELGTEMSRETIKTAYIESFKNEIGVDLIPGSLTNNEQNCLIGLIEERKTEEWIYGKDLTLQELKTDTWATKVRGGIKVSEIIHKAGKLIRLTVVSEEDVIRGIGISGDFFTIPYMGVISNLEESLVGVKLEKSDLMNAINRAFECIGLTIYGVEKVDFVDALLKIKTTF